MKITRPILSTIFKKLTFSEQQIVNYINEFSDPVFTMSQKELALATFSSEATVSRLVKKLNFQNYKAFSIGINQSLVNLDQKYPMYQEKSMLDIGKNIINTHLFALAHGLDQTMINKLIMLAQKINLTTANIWIYGLGSSHSPALELANNLKKIGIKAICPADFHVLLPFLAIIDKKDIIILFSNSGANKEINFIVNQVAQQKPHVVLITSNSNITLPVSQMIHYKKIHHEHYLVPISSKTINNLVCDVIFQSLLHLNKVYKKRLQKGLEIIEQWKNS